MTTKGIEKAYSGDLIEVIKTFDESYSVGDILEVDMRMSNMGACDDNTVCTTEGYFLHDSEYKIFKKVNERHYPVFRLLVHQYKCTHCDLIVLVERKNGADTMFGCPACERKMEPMRDMLIREEK